MATQSSPITIAAAPAGSRPCRSSSSSGATRMTAVRSRLTIPNSIASRER